MTLENPDQDSESIRNQRNSDDHKGYPDQQINTEAAKFEAPPPNANPHQSCKHKKRWLDYGTFAVEVLRIVGLGIYCSLTLGIYYAGKNSIEIATKTLQENKRQFNDTLVQMKLQTAAQMQSAQSAADAIQTTQKQMLLDQRAWVGFSDLTTKYTAGNQLAGSVIINNGRTPARNIHAIIVFGDISRTGELHASDELWMRKVIFAARKTPFGRNEYLTNDPQGVGDHGGFKFIYEPNLIPRDVAGGIIHAPMEITVGTLTPGEQYPLMGIGRPLEGGNEWSAES